MKDLKLYKERRLKRYGLSRKPQSFEEEEVKEQVKESRKLRKQIEKKHELKEDAEDI